MAFLSCTILGHKYWKINQSLTSPMTGLWIRPCYLRQVRCLCDKVSFVQVCPTYKTRCYQLTYRNTIRILLSNLFPFTSSFLKWMFFFVFPLHGVIFCKTQKIFQFCLQLVSTVSLWRYVVSVKNNTLPICAKKSCYTI